MSSPQITKMIFIRFINAIFIGLLLTRFVSQLENLALNGSSEENSELVREATCRSGEKFWRALISLTSNLESSWTIGAGCQRGTTSSLSLFLRLLLIHLLQFLFQQPLLLLLRQFGKQ